ncbi:MAG: multiprotein-bridging factor 1 family protein [Xanthobacter sp.]
MTQTTISGRQIKAARALLGWCRKDLAARAGVSAPTVKFVETDESHLPSLAETRQAMRTTLEASGIQFTLGEAPAVQLMPTALPASKPRDTDKA